MYCHAFIAYLVFPVSRLVLFEVSAEHIQGEGISLISRGNVKKKVEIVAKYVVRVQNPNTQ